jgi:glucose-6-phosphate isomerase
MTATPEHSGGAEAPEAPAPARSWLAGLRRAWVAGGALARWVEDRGVMGAIWTPSAYEVEDVADAAASLIRSGARPDASLLWDLALTDIRAAADALAEVYRSSDGKDGYVAVWVDPSRISEPGRAVAAADELIGDVGKPNVAVALAWSPARAAVVESLVGTAFAVAVSGVRDASALEALSATVRRGHEKLRSAVAAEEVAEPPEPKPVFSLAGSVGNDLVDGVAVQTEFTLFGSQGGPRLPLSPDAEQAGWKVAAERLAVRAERPVREDAYMPASYAQAVLRECAELRGDEVLEDVWSRDHTIWKDDPTEIANRLGWLDAPEHFHAQARDLSEFARKARAGGDIARVVVCGMGGSVFACEMFDRVLGGGIPLTVLDSTHPDHIAAVTASLDLEHTLFVVSSKSGTTVETRSHLEHFWSLVGRGDRFVAVTDPGSELASLARERGFLRVFENPPEIGGRFSGLSYFGLVPAALSGVDIEAVLAGARRAMAHNGAGVAEPFAPGVRLGAALAEAAMGERRDKLTFVLPPQLDSFGVWVEQMLAESLGKEGKGIVPVLGEPFGAHESYGPDRVFCMYSLGDDAEPPQVEALEGEHPFARIRIEDAKSLGAEMYRWEVATAIVGYLLDINPFDQPDVEAAKQRAREALSRPPTERPETGSAAEVLDGLEPPRYLALQAFLPPTDDNARRLEVARGRFRDRFKVPVTVGFGPRFLHSTGQLHKGGPNTGSFLQVTGEHSTDIDVPGMGFTFGRLIDAQADGDLAALRDVGRAVARISLDELERLAT